jgi:SAM-dependent methyltransferase
MLSFLVDKVIGYEYKGSTIDVTLSTDGMSALQQIILNNFFRKKQNNLEFHFYEKLPLDIENETLDGIVLYGVIEHLDGKIKENVLSELHRILKPEGYLFLAKLPRQCSYQEQVARLLNMPSHKILFTQKNIMDLLDNRFSVRNIERTDLFFQYSPLTNALFPNTRTEMLITNYLNFLTFIAHNFRIVAIKRG